MKRRHLVEIHDAPWCPDVVRRLATDYLHTVGAVFRAFRPAVPRLAALVRETGARRIVDLCSGGTGPAVFLGEELHATAGLDVEVVLTDLFPNAAAFARAARTAHVPVRGELVPVDARQVPASLDGVRMLFDAFHHFRPEEARAILEDAFRKRVGILVVEGTERSVRGILGLALFAPLLVLVLTPLVRPFTWWRLLFTYVIPVAPLLVLFDGVVSCLRTYTTEELREMTEGLRGNDYTWEIGVDRVAGQPLTYLVGTPLTRSF
jgi:hypothetical protein